MAYAREPRTVIYITSRHVKSGLNRELLNINNRK
jgi:hypothetical protein